MKVLIVKKKDSCWPFVEEQVNALCALTAESQEPRAESLEFAWHLIEGKGMMAYVKDALRLIRTILKEKPDVIHAHYGMSGYYACLVTRLMFRRKRVPVVVTYHGSDINQPKVRKISQRAIRMADYNICVSPKLKEQVQCGKNSQVIPCGLNMEDWEPLDKKTARKKMGLSMEKRYVLFSSDFQTEVKNPMLAKQAIENCRLEIGDLELIELTGYTRAEVNKLMHAVDVCLLTSRTEGSPQFIKEAMACGCPIVTTDVGDAKFVIGNTKGCYVVESREPRAESQEPRVECVVEALKKAMEYAEKKDRTEGRKRINELGYSNDVVAAKIRDIYFRLVYGV